MKIEIHNTSVHADIIIGEDADAYDCIDALIGAMIIAGYGVETVHGSFRRRAKDMEGIGDEV
jgi:hypothetical protein